MKRIKSKIESIAISHNSIEVSLQGISYLHYINPSDVSFWSTNKEGNSVKQSLSVGTEIEFDADINTKTRNLKNVKIILNA
jgi:uncharacterized pyridoxamine 5'-phosphate oxidase family protein